VKHLFVTPLLASLALAVVPPAYAEEPDPPGAAVNEYYQFHKRPNPKLETREARDANVFKERQVPAILAALKYDLNRGNMSQIPLAERQRLSAILDDPGLHLIYTGEQPKPNITGESAAAQTISADTILLHYLAFYSGEDSNPRTSYQIAQLLLHEIGHVDQRRNSWSETAQELNPLKERHPTWLEGQLPPDDFSNDAIKNVTNAPQDTPADPQSPASPTAPGSPAPTDNGAPAPASPPSDSGDSTPTSTGTRIEVPASTPPDDETVPSSSPEDALGSTSSICPGPVPCPSGDNPNVVVAPGGPIVIATGYRGPWWQGRYDGGYRGGCNGYQGGQGGYNGNQGGYQGAQGGDVLGRRGGAGGQGGQGGALTTPRSAGLPGVTGPKGAPGPLPKKGGTSAKVMPKGRSQGSPSAGGRASGTASKTVPAPRNNPGQLAAAAKKASPVQRTPARAATPARSPSAKSAMTSAPSRNAQASRPAAARSGSAARTGSTRSASASSGQRSAAKTVSRGGASRSGGRRR
jgi:hypothetical protein